MYVRIALFTRLTVGDSRCPQVCPQVRSRCPQNPQAVRVHPQFPHAIHSRCPPSWTALRSCGFTSPQAVDEGWGQRCGRAPAVHRSVAPCAERVEGSGESRRRARPPLGRNPWETRWTTGGQLGVAVGGGEGCGRRAGLHPGSSTRSPPVDNVSELQKRRRSTVCTGPMKTTTYLFREKKTNHHVWGYVHSLVTWVETPGSGERPPAARLKVRWGTSHPTRPGGIA